MIVTRERHELAEARGRWRGPVGYVATMGALHAGHAALIDAAREHNASVLVSIFVNPMQFGANEDLSSYPRSLDDDLELCEKHGVDAVWAPSYADVYPAGPAQVSVLGGVLATELEGAARPTHFAGVLTVVAKYFGLIRPDVAYFGEKDYQQLTLIRRMVGDLELGVTVTGVPTVREPDGLALSSRNVYLDAAQRQQATALSRALFAGQAASGGGATAVLAAAQHVLDAETAVVPDYLALRSAELGPAPEHGAARLLVAARVGTTRLIDNVGIEL